MTTKRPRFVSASTSFSDQSLNARILPRFRCGGELVDFSAEFLQRKNMPSKLCNVVGMFMLKLLSTLE